MQVLVLWPAQLGEGGPMLRPSYVALHVALLIKCMT